MLSRLREFKKTGKKIIVCGCMASAQPSLVKSIVPDAWLLPPQYTYHILDLIDNQKVSFKIKNKTLLSKYYGDITAPISIAEGCLFSCSYCITSYARGKLKSYPIKEVKKDVSYALKQGCKEIQLTAQDTSSYGLDSDHNLGELLTDICEVKGEYRIRVGMMNPFTLLKNLDSIIEAFHDDKIYKFLHIPVQSGDNKILKKMNRKYRVDDFIEIIKKFREKYPDLTVSTDIIVGFPSEKNKQFQHTINLLQNVKPDIINITRYSARPYTIAKEMNGRVKTDIVKIRSRKLTELCNLISEKNNLKYIGKKYTLLITKKGKNDTFIGRTENYKPVIIDEEVKIGEFLPVKIINSSTTHLFGSLI
jgi:MiaB-like tRNA modifying enzyme